MRSACPSWDGRRATCEKEEARARPTGAIHRRGPQASPTRARHAAGSVPRPPSLLSGLRSPPTAQERQCLPRGLRELSQREPSARAGPGGQAPALGRRGAQVARSCPAGTERCLRPPLRVADCKHHETRKGEVHGYETRASISPSGALAPSRTASAAPARATRRR